MQYQIFIERPNQNGFVAEAVGVPNCVATGSTEEEAINGIRQALQARLSQGKIVTIELDASTLLENERAELQSETSGTKTPAGNPWIDGAGIWRNDPTFDDLMQKIEEYRREADEQKEPVVGAAGANA